MSKSNYKVGWWDCPQCGRKHIYGLEDICPGCGFAQSEEVEFYLDESSEYLSEEEADKIDKGPKWYCSYCGTANRANEKVCNQCGAPKNENKGDYFKYYSNTTENKTEQTRIKRDTVERSVDIQENDSNIIFNILNIIKNNKKMSIGIVSAILMMFLVIWALVPKEKTIHVDDMSWTYIINIDELKTFHENGWYLPSGARLEYTRWEFRRTDRIKTGTRTETYTDTERVKVGTEKYKSGTRNLGNGVFEDVYGTRDKYETRTVTKTREVDVYTDVPVYDTKYYYEIDRYVYDRSITTSNHDKNPYWGEFSLEELEKESSRQEFYNVYSTNKKDEKITYTADKDDWYSINIGDDIKCKVDITNHIDLITE